MHAFVYLGDGPVELSCQQLPACHILCLLQGLDESFHRYSIVERDQNGTVLLFYHACQQGPNLYHPFTALQEAGGRNKLWSWEIDALPGLLVLLVGELASNTQAAFQECGVSSSG